MLKENQYGTSFTYKINTNFFRFPPQKKVKYEYFNIIKHETPSLT